MLCNTPLLKTSEASMELCDEKTTIGECMSVLNEMPLNKSSGNDGLSVEFYRTFWPVIGNVVIDFFNTNFERGELSNTQKQVVITLNKTKDKDPLFIRNYKPITLLNVDYKACIQNFG